MIAKETVEKIKSQFNENINSHVFLMETNNTDKALLDVKNIIKSVIKSDEVTSKQIDDENYIEMIIIKTDGKEIKKDEIINLQERIKTKPILSKYIFYIILEADKLNDVASNKLLKTIEEPENSIIGFLIASKDESILPTIKSRCQIETLIYNKEEKNTLKEIDVIAVEIITLIESKSLIDFNIYKLKEKNFKETGKDVANRIKDYYNTACNVEITRDLDSTILKLIIDNNSYENLIKKCKYLNKTLNKLTANMNKGILLEKIYIELKEVN